MNKATLQKYGLEITRPQGGYGDWVWSVDEVYHVSSDLNNGAHNIFVDTYVKQDPSGTVETDAGLLVSTFDRTQLVSTPVICWWSGERVSHPLPKDHSILQTWTEKPKTEPGCNFPMFSQATYSLSIYGRPSDVIRGFHTRHPDEGPGATWGHHSFYVTFLLTRLAPSDVVVPPIDPGGGDQPPPPSESLVEYVRRSSWDEAGVNYNADAAFFKYAQAHELGKPETQEFDLEHVGVTYRVQCYVMGIVFCVVGDWGNIRFIRW